MPLDFLYFIKVVWPYFTLLVSDGALKFRQSVLFPSIDGSKISHWLLTV